MEVFTIEEKRKLESLNVKRMKECFTSIENKLCKLTKFFVITDESGLSPYGSDIFLDLDNQPFEIPYETVFEGGSYDSYPDRVFFFLRLSSYGGSYPLEIPPYIKEFEIWNESEFTIPVEFGFKILNGFPVGLKLAPNKVAIFRSIDGHCFYRLEDIVK